MAIWDEWLGNFANPGWVSSLLGVAFWSFIFLAVAIVAGIYVRGLIKYRYYGTVHKRRQDNYQGIPDSERIQGKAGYFKMGGLDVYRIKYGMWPWQIVNIKKLPDPRYMTANKREAIFLQYNIGEYVQAKQTINWKKGEIEIEPVDSTTKGAAKQELQAYRSILDSNKFKEYVGPIMMGLIFIAGIVALYFVQQACSG